MLFTSHTVALPIQFGNHTDVHTLKAFILEGEWQDACRCHQTGALGELSPLSEVKINLSGHNTDHKSPKFLVSLHIFVFPPRILQILAASNWWKTNNTFVLQYYCPLFVEWVSHMTENYQYVFLWVVFVLHHSSNLIKCVEVNEPKCKLY